MATNKPEQLCLLQIGYRKYVMSLDAGVSAMKLLSKALEVEADFTGDELRYIAQPPAELEMKIISSAQIDMPNASPTAGRRAKPKQLMLEQS